MVFDCLILDGELLVQKSFDRRIGRVHQFVHKPLTKCIERFPEEQRFFPFDVIPKPMEKPYAIENVFIQLADLPHGNDGLIFTAKGAVYSFGTDEMIIKWKPPEENTIDFRLHVGDFQRSQPPTSPRPLRMPTSPPTRRRTSRWKINPWQTSPRTRRETRQWQTRQRQGRTCPRQLR